MWYANSILTLFSFLVNIVQVLRYLELKNFSLRTNFLPQRGVTHNPKILYLDIRFLTLSP